MSGRKYCSNKNKDLLDVGLKLLTRANCRPLKGLMISSFFALKKEFRCRSPPFQFGLKRQIDRRNKYGKYAKKKKIKG